MNILSAPFAGLKPISQLDSAANVKFTLLPSNRNLIQQRINRFANHPFECNFLNYSSGKFYISEYLSKGNPFDR